jgi:hypothetical protein
VTQLEILSSDKMVKGILIGKALDKYAGLAFRALPKDQFQFTLYHQMNSRRRSSRATEMDRP